MTNLDVTAETLGQLVKSFADMPTEKAGALRCAQKLLMAQAIVIELARHLADGIEPYDAMEATARGELSLPEPAATVFGLLTAKPKG